MTKKDTRMQYGARALILFGAAGIAMAASQPVAAQDAEQCFPNGTGYICFEPGTGDLDENRIFGNDRDIGGLADGFYDNLEEKIELLTPTEQQEEDAQNAVDAAQEQSDDFNAANDAVQASLTDENLEDFAAVETAEADLQAASEAQLAAGETLNETNTAFNEASDDLTEANTEVSAAQAVVTNAQNDVDNTQATFDGNQSQANLNALNDALAVRDDAQADLDDAETDRAAALAVANEAADVLADAQDAFGDANDLLSDAGDALVMAGDELNTGLAANDDFVDAIADANGDLGTGFTADEQGLANLEANTEIFDTNLARQQAAQAGLDDAVNTLIRANEVLAPAADNGNAAIAAAAQAYLGDPRADETNAEVEVVAALVDHENRITTNTADIATNRTDIDLNTANITLNRTDIDTNTANITVNAEAIVTESETRAAADAAILDQFASEQNARIAADTALQDEITSIGARVTGIEGRLSELDDRISSSTATAIALGGMAFLPDMKFNLAVAAGFYEGSQAIAANVGYRISNNVAITAGIGSGLNGESGTGGRVGFVIGF